MTCGSLSMSRLQLRLHLADTMSFQSLISSCPTPMHPLPVSKAQAAFASLLPLLTLKLGTRRRLSSQLCLRLALRSAQLLPSQIPFGFPLASLDPKVPGGPMSAVVGGEPGEDISDDDRWAGEEFAIGELYPKETASTSGRSQEERSRGRTRVGSRASVGRSKEENVGSVGTRRQRENKDAVARSQMEHSRRGWDPDASDSGEARGQKGSKAGRSSSQSGADTWRKQPMSSRPDFSEELRREGVVLEDEAERRVQLEESAQKVPVREPIKRQPLSRRPDFTAALRSVEAEAEKETAGGEGKGREGNLGADSTAADPSLGGPESGVEAGPEQVRRGLAHGARMGKAHVGEIELTEATLAKWVLSDTASAGLGEGEKDVPKGHAGQPRDGERGVRETEDAPPSPSAKVGGGRGFRVRGSERIPGGTAYKSELGFGEGSGQGRRDMGQGGEHPAGIPRAGRRETKVLEDGQGAEVQAPRLLIGDEPTEPTTAARWHEEAAGRLQLALGRNQTREALGVVRAIVTNGGLPPKESFCRLIGQLCKTGSFHMAWNLFQEVGQGRAGLGEVHLDERTFGLLIKTALQEGEALKAAELLEAMVRQDLQPRVATWSSVVARLGRAPDTAPLALELFDCLCAKAGMGGEGGPMSPDTGAFNAAMNAAVTAGRLPYAEALLREAMPRRGVAADCVGFNILIKGYAMAGQPDKMVEAVDLMKAHGVLPDVTTYNTLVAAYVGIGDLAAAEGVVAEMARLGGALRPGVRTLTILLKGLLQGQQLDAAAALLLEMRDKFGCAPNEVSFTTLIGAYVGIRKMDSARHLLTQMAQLGIPASVVTYNTLLNGYCHAEQLDEAKALLEDMVKAGIKPTAVTFNTMIDGSIRRDDNAEALEWFQRMRREGLHPTAATYTNLINAFGNSGTPRLAARIFEEMRKDLRVRIDRPAWNSMVHCYARAGLMEEAEGTVEAMKAAGVEPSIPTFGTMIRGYAKAGKAGEALVMWREIKERQMQYQRRLQQREGSPRAWAKEEKEEAFVVDEAIVDDLLNACVRAGYFARALEIVKEMEQAGIPTDRLKYKRLFIELYSDLRSSRRARAPEQDEEEEEEGAGGWPEARHQGVEAFKFWLGLPNRYYQRDWTWGRHR